MMILLVDKTDRISTKIGKRLYNNIGHRQHFRVERVDNRMETCVSQDEKAVQGSQEKTSHHPISSFLCTLSSGGSDRPEEHKIDTYVDNQYPSMI
jgi:hypothetical protein